MLLNTINEVNVSLSILNENENYVTEKICTYVAIVVVRVTKGISRVGIHTVWIRFSANCLACCSPIIVGCLKKKIKKNKYNKNLF